MQQILRIGRDLGQVGRAKKPEPRVANQRARHRKALPQSHPQDRTGLTKQIPVHLKRRQGRTSCRHRSTGEVTGDRHQYDAASDQLSVAFAGHHHASGDGAGEDGQKGAHLHQRVAADQFVVLKQLRQHRVFDRPEQRGLSPHAEQHGQQQRQVAQQQTGRTAEHDEDLASFDRPDQPLLGVLLTQLAAQRREQKERQDEQQRAQIDQQTGVGVRADLVEDRQNQRLLEQVVVESAR